MQGAGKAAEGTASATDKVGKASATAAAALQGTGQAAEGTAENFDNMGESAEKAGDKSQESNEKTREETEKTEKQTEKSASKMAVFFEKMGAAARKVGEVTVTALKASAGAVTALTGIAIKGYSSYEQLTGGIETLFGAAGKSLEEYAESQKLTVDEAKDQYNALIEAQELMFSNASKAYETAGKSANGYMEMAINSSAAMIQSLGGDTKKAAEMVNMAIIDMSDNVNKMGTDMEGVENAYKGFSKSNFSMLDNLALGYGGTKAEMARLIKDAEKIDDTFTASRDKNGELAMSYAEIVEAIHIVQTEMGITGTTANEAASTIEGSAGSMKAAWTNVATGLADENANLGELLQNAFAATETFGKNIIPRVQQTLQGIGTAFNETVPYVIDKVPALFQSLAPGMIGAVESLLQPVGQAVINYAPILLQSGYDTALSLIDGLSSGAASAIPEFLNQALPLVLEFTGTIREKAGDLIDSGLELAENLAQGIVDGIPAVIENVPGIISNVAGVINDNAPKVLISAGKIMLTLGKGLLDNIPKLVENIPEIIRAAVDVFLAFNWINLGKSIITGLANGIKSMAGSTKNIAQSIFNGIKGIFTNLPGTLKSLGSKALSLLKGVFSAGKSQLGTVAKMAFQAIISAILTMPGKLNEQGKKAVDFVKNAFKIDWGSVGRNVVDGITKGLSNGIGSLVESAKTAAHKMLSAAKEALGIRSPSKAFEKEVGEMAAEGIIKGVNNKKSAVGKSGAELAEIYVNTAKEKADKLVNSGKLSQAGLMGYWKRISEEARSKLSGVTKDYEKTIAALNKENSKLDAAEAKWKALKKSYDDQIDSLKKLQEGQKSSVAELKKVQEQKKKELSETKKGTAAYKEAKAAYDSATAAVKNAQEGGKAIAEQLKKTREALAKEKAAYTESTKATKENAKALQDRAKQEEKSLKALETAQNNYWKTRKKLESEVKKIDAQYKKDVSSLKTQLIKDIQAVTDAYDKSVEDRRKDILKQMKLFEEFAKNDAVDSKTLITNMKSQAEAAEEYNQVMSNLAQRRGMTSELYEELKSVGAEDSETLLSIARMTDEEFSEYVKLFERRNAAALDRSRQENEDLKEQSRQQIEDLISQANKDLNALEKEYSKNLKALGVTAADQSQGIGQNIVKGLIKGIKTENSAFQKELKAFFRSIESTAKDSLQIHSPSRLFKDDIGKNIVLGLRDGVIGYAGRVYDAVGNLSAGLADAFHSEDLLDKAASAVEQISTYLDTSISSTAASMDIAAIDQNLDRVSGITAGTAASVIPGQVSGTAGGNVNNSNITNNSNVNLSIQNFYGRTRDELKELLDYINTALQQMKQRDRAAFG